MAAQYSIIISLSIIDSANPASLDIWMVPNTWPLRMLPDGQLCSRSLSPSLIISCGRFLASLGQRSWACLKLLICVVKLTPWKAGLGVTPQWGLSALRQVSDTSSHLQPWLLWLPCLTLFSWLPGET